MADYDPHEWWRHFFDIKGSMIVQIVGRVASCLLWAVLIVSIDKLFRITWHMSPTVHTLVGTALGLLLVLRTNASYERWWEGRKLWGSIINESRNLARLASTHLKADGALCDSVVGWASVFPAATMHRLRDTRGLGVLASQLPAHEVALVMESDHVPLAVARKLTALLAAARDRGMISDYVMIALDQNVQQLVDYLGGCERIHRTPLPFAYVVHARRALILYAFALPIALVDIYGWATIPITLIVAYILFGIEEIGVEIEDPFGQDDNDLPLESFVETIEDNLVQMNIAASLSVAGMAPVSHRPGLHPDEERSGLTGAEAEERRGPAADGAA
jgi:putative membrane protein